MLDKLSKTITDQVVKLTTIRRRDGRWFIYYKTQRYWDIKLQKMLSPENNELSFVDTVMDLDRYVLLDFHCIRSSRSLFRLVFETKAQVKSLSPKDEPKLWIEKSLSNFYLPGCNFLEYIKNIKSDLNYLLAYESDEDGYNPTHPYTFKNMVALSFTDSKEAAMFKLQFC